MKKLIVVVITLTLMVGTVLVTGCDDTSENEIKIAYGDWACATAKTYLVAGILEEKMGYDVETTMAELGMVYTDIANGRQDFYVAGWFPATHESYLEEHGDDIELLSTVYENARIGLVVPEYVDIDSIEDMGDYYDEFDGEIVGIDSGAGIMQSTDNALEVYDSLSDFDLLSSSEAQWLQNLVEQ